MSGYDREADTIKSERRPFRVKRMSHDIKPNQDWEDIEESVMREILLEKFTQIEFCRKFLLDTGKANLFEGTGDRKWGCGIPISKSDQITFRNPGRNLLGHLLESVRGELRPK